MKAKLKDTASIDFESWEFIEEEFDTVQKLVKGIQVIAAQVVIRQIYEDAKITIVSEEDRAWVEAPLWEDGPWLKVDLRELLREALDPTDYLADTATILRVLKELVAEAEDALAVQAKSP